MNRILAWFLVALIFAMSGPLQAATMASARGFEKSLYGRSAPRADKYAYCSGDPINASDPSGLVEGPEQLLKYLGQQRGPFVVNVTRGSTRQASHVALRMAAANPEAWALIPVGVAGYGVHTAWRALLETHTKELAEMERHWRENAFAQYPSETREYQSTPPHERFVPESHYQQQREQRAPRYSAPYTVHLRSNPNGTLHQATTYDAYGRRANQFDFGGRHGDEVHPFVYPPAFQNPEGLRTHPGVQLNQHGLRP